MSKKLAFNIFVLALTSLQLACGESSFTANFSEQKNSSNISNNTETNTTSNANNNSSSQQAFPENIKPIDMPEQQPIKDEVIEAQLSNCKNNQNGKKICSEIVKPNENCVTGLLGNKVCKPNPSPEVITKPEQNCSISLTGEKVCLPTSAMPIKPQPVEPTNPIATNKLCVDTDGDGKGKYYGSNNNCTGNLQLDRHIYQQIRLTHNNGLKRSYQVNNINCTDNIKSFLSSKGCFQGITSNSRVFNDFARKKGISKHGAIAKFYKAGNTLTPLDKTLIIVSPYNPLGTESIDWELNWLFSKAKKTNSKLSQLLNYLHVNGISVLYVSLGHLANTSQPVVDKSKALAEIILKFNKVRAANSTNTDFEKTNIIGLSLGGVVAKKALTLIESRNQNHLVNLYFSMDSPHLGAHVPLGLQYLPDSVSRVFDYAKRKTKLAGVFDFLLDDILNLNFITKPLAQGAGMLGQASDAAGNFLDANYNNIPSNELLAYNILAKEGLQTDEHKQMKRDTASLPRNTHKNIAIANGSIAGRRLSSRTYLKLRTSKRNKVEISLFVNPRGNSDKLTYAWIKFPDRNKLFLGSRTYYHQYDGVTKVTEDTIPCGTTTDIIKGAETGINQAVSLNWNEKVEVSNYKTCFIPTASALMSADGNTFKNSSFNASQSAFHEIIGTDINTNHMTFSTSITQQIISKFNQYRKIK